MEKEFNTNKEEYTLRQALDRLNNTNEELSTLKETIHKIKTAIINPVSFPQLTFTPESTIDLETLDVTGDIRVFGSIPSQYNMIMDDMNETIKEIYAIVNSLTDIVG